MQFETVIECLPWGIVVIDGHRKIISANAKACSLLRRATDDLMGYECAKILGSALCRTACPLSSKNSCSGCDENGCEEGLTDRILPWVAKDRTIIGCIHVLSEPEKAKDKIVKTPNLSEFGLLGNSSLLHEVSYLIRSVAPTTSTVLIQGETGTGKEIAAQIIHKLSGFEKQPFISLNCAALPENLIESELFGHNKGAFTGADRDSKGYFETAQRGTIFLDEIAETSLFFQAKLLRVLQSGEYQRLGSALPKKTGARIIAASNKDLATMVKSGRFRDDLFYRLNVFPIKMPPLRDRIADLPLLVNYFIKDFSSRMNKPIEGMTEVALTLLFRYDFPGNVRELKNIIEYAFIKGSERLIGPADLPPTILDHDSRKQINSAVVTDQKMIELLAEFNRNKAKTARALGISRKTLYKKLKELRNRDELGK